MTICIPSETDWSCYGTQQEIESLDPVIKARSEALAWYTLARLCAYRIGVCPTTVRPCSAGCLPGSVTWMEAVVDGGHTGGLPLRTIGGSFTPHITGGNWVNSCGCRRAGDCSCSSLNEVILPGPVGGIETIRIDGAVIAPSRYRVDNGNRLVATDPELAWPTCQDMQGDEDAEDTFYVTYYQGAAPNELTRFAAGLLAVEFYKACSGKKCKLPRGVTSVVRRGVTIEINTETFEGGVTGIEGVDAVIGIYNPNHLKQAPTVRSPDYRPGRVRRSTWLVG